MKFQNIAKDVKLGKNVKIFDFVNLYGCEIQDNTKIGTFVEIQKGVTIGKNCKIYEFIFRHLLLIFRFSESLKYREIGRASCRERV